jgi:peptide/nickel transport system permease protein
MPATLKLMVFGVFFAIGLGIPIGVIAGVSPGSRIDGVARTGALLGQAVPSFWLGIMLILLFAVQLGWLPTSGEHGLKSMILPGITLGSFSIAAMTRLTRSTVLDIWDTEYVRLLMVKGLPRRLVIWKHVVKNAALPVMTLASLQMIAFLSGSVIVEQIFAWPGVGRVAVEAVFSRDFPLIQTVVVINTVLLVLMNLVVDLAYVAIDPRIRFTAAK